MLGKQKLTAALAALIMISTVMTGAVAAADSRTDKTTFDSGNAVVTVYDPPERGYNDGSVAIDLSDSSLSSGNITSVTGDDGTTFSDQTGDIQVYEFYPSYSTVNDSGGSYDISIYSDGSLATNLTVITEQTDVVESDTVNASTINNASSVNVTVDVSEINQSKYLTGNISENASFVNIHHGDPPIAGSFKVETNTTGDVTFNVKDRSSTAVGYSADSLPSGDRKLFVPESVDEIEIDGQVVYEESLFSPGGGDGDGGGIGGMEVLAVIAVVAVGLLAYREL